MTIVSNLLIVYENKIGTRRGYTYLAKEKGQLCYRTTTKGKEVHKARFIEIISQLKSYLSKHPTLDIDTLNSLHTIVTYMKGQKMNSIKWKFGCLREFLSKWQNKLNGHGKFTSDQIAGEVLDKINELVQKAEIKTDRAQEPYISGPPVTVTSDDQSTLAPLPPVKATPSAQEILSFRRGRIAKKILRVWRNKPDYRGPMGAWLKKYEKDYVAHALRSTNVDKMIQFGRIMPNEAVFRKTGALDCGVEHVRTNSAATRNIKTPDFSRDLKLKFDGLKKKLALKFYERNNVSIIESTKKQLQNAKTDEQRQEILEVIESYKTTHIHSDPSSKEVQYDPFKWESKDETPPAVKYYQTNNDIEFLEEYDNLLKDFPELKAIPIGHFKIFLDQMRDPAERIDHILAKHYENLKASPIKDLKETEERTVIDRECSTIRRDLFGNLESSLEAMRNSIDWGYGDVMVLRGYAAEIINFEVGGFAYLKAPYQNGGDFLCLELAQADTVVLGSRTILKKYANNKNYKNITFIFTEDLTPRQRHKLGVQTSS